MTTELKEAEAVRQALQPTSIDNIIRTLQAILPFHLSPPDIKRVIDALKGVK